MATKEELYKLRSEKLVNEAWGEARKHLNELVDILHRGPKSEEEVEILVSAAFAFLQRATLEEAEDKALFGNEFCS